MRYDTHVKKRVKSNDSNAAYVCPLSTLRNLSDF